MNARLTILTLFCAGLFLNSALAAPPCDPIKTFADGKSPRREIFIAPDGDDSSGRGTREQPFRTIRRAIGAVSPGEAIRLLPGNYETAMRIEGLAGSPDAPIWLGGVPGEPRPVIRGSNAGIQITKGKYLILENLEVTGARGNGLNCDDGGEFANPESSGHLLFRNLFIHQIGVGGNQDGLKLSGIYDFYVIDCAFEKISTGGSGIDHVGCHRGVIAGCTFTDMGSNSIQCKGGSSDIEIRGNRFQEGGQRAINLGGSTGFVFFRPPLSATFPNYEAKNIRVIANLFVGSDTPIAFVGAVESLVANNTIVHPRRWILRILQETVSTPEHEFLACGSNRFINNLISFDRRQISTHLNIGSHTDAASFEFANNLWFAADQPAQSRPDLPSSEISGVYGKDPLFRDIAGGDYSLKPESPAVGRGRLLKEVRADLRQNCFKNPPAIGAIATNLDK